MSVRVSSHATAELLSAYLDQQLVEPEARQLEAHLEECAECHGRLEGLRRVIANLRGLESHEPSDELQKAVARRIALAGEPKPFLDRMVSGLSIFNRQSTLLPMFAVVLALAIFIYLFSVAVEQSQSGLTPVVFDAPAIETDDPREIAGRRLTLRDGAWVEADVDPQAAARILTLDSEEGRRLLAEYPDLEGLTALAPPAVIEIDGEIVELRW